MISASLKRYIFSVFLVFGLFINAQLVPEKPAVLYPVYDKANLLSESEKDALNQKLIKFSDSTSTEIEVIILPTTNGEDVNYLATMYGEKWGIGQKGVDNGVVFLIATEDHTMSIQQGRAVEQYLTASVAGQILDYLVTPSFKKGEWYNGIDQGTSAIMEAVQGKFKPIVKKQNKDGGISIGSLVLIVIVIIILLSIINKNNGGNNDDDDYTLSRKGSRRYGGGFFPFPGSFGGGGFGGGSSGGSSGGGFGGFGGGGSFGGGGASGGW
ncbi:TPM domain-containing protein [Epilithonimonas ginsengisoli]|uniref:TPM domain-containing protein n=1 Tax=Epilithonimonas ginsengisoli TaxID=1245592 RepID=A0ABU4JHR5_9FLAO|nr:MULTISPECIES: TPM domain-containing protein [Chryseobacterium group]MBV6880678.1 TPM domain-containing protein [Epilithonimonas sp. FP105]MDW8549223.1 TPM domain-containing protein [Epilithonimonas ginsengisoli]OAH70352.1 methanol dehydrogenase [Chryseobacterium sp. FP211-J200]